MRLENIKSQQDYDNLVSNYLAEYMPKVLNFKGDEFDFKLSLYGDLNKVTFENCDFKKALTFSVSIDFEVEFKSCRFHDEVDLSDINFNNKYRNINCKFFKRVILNNTSFKELCDFYGTEFHKRVIFFKTDFFETVVFSGCIFYENALFTYTLIDKIAIFRRAKFVKGLDLSLLILKGDLALFSIFLNDFKSISEPIFEGDYVKYIGEKGDITHKNKRETYRIIKNQLLSQNNYIEATFFRSIEYKVYKRQLWQQLKHSIKFWSNEKRTTTSSERRRWRDNLLELSKLIGDYIILLMNNYSNGHKYSWSRGVFFTFAISVLFFYFCIISLDEFKFCFFCLDTIEIAKNLFPSYVRFLNPVHKINFLEHSGVMGINIKSSPCFYIWDYFGRVMISFGIYQTVQAFRKYK